MRVNFISGNGVKKELVHDAKGARVAFLGASKQLVEKDSLFNAHVSSHGVDEVDTAVDALYRAPGVIKNSAEGTVKSSRLVVSGAKNVKKTPKAVGKYLAKSVAVGKKESALRIAKATTGKTRKITMYAAKTPQRKAKRHTRKVKNVALNLLSSKVLIVVLVLCVLVMYIG